MSYELPLARDENLFPKICARHSVQAPFSSAAREQLPHLFDPQIWTEAIRLPSSSASEARKVRAESRG
jgi:hypothetical protein